MAIDQANDECDCPWCVDGEDPMLTVYADPTQPGQPVDVWKPWATREW